MDDVASRIRAALDQVEPVSVAEVEAVAGHRRTRRRRQLGLGCGLALTAAIALVVAFAVQPASRPTTVVVRPAGGGPPVGSATTSTTAATAPAGPAALSANPLFRVVREVDLPYVTGALYVEGALFTWADIGGDPVPPGRVSRIDVATARVTATADLTASGAAFAGGLLWVTTGTEADSAPQQVVALDPDTLAVVHTVSVPGTAGDVYDESDRGDIASAGGLVWVVGNDALYGIDPATAGIVRRVSTPPPPAVNGYHFGPGDYGVNVAAPPDGSALWTAESVGGGGADGLQVRNPQTGAVIYSSPGSLLSIGGTEIAAGDGYAWLAVASGSLGAYGGVREQPGLPTILSDHDVAAGSNGVAVSLAAGDLWVYDPGSRNVECVDPTSGKVLDQDHLPVTDVATLSGGQMAVVSNAGPAGSSIVAIATPEPGCAA